MIVGLIVVGILQVICLLALVDQYKGLLQIRTVLKLVDRPYDLQLVEEEAPKPSVVGLPASFDTQDVVIVIVFSTKCASCVTVAQGMRGRISDRAWALIAAGSEDQCRQFQTSVGLPSERILIDVGGRIAGALNIRTFPSAVVFSNGKLKSATTIPSYRQLRNLIEESVTDFAPATENGRTGKWKAISDH